MAAHVGQLAFSAATIRRVGFGLVGYGALGLILVTAALVGGWSGITRIDAAMGSVAEASAALEAVAVVAAGAHPATTIAVKMSAVIRVISFSLSRDLDRLATPSP